MKNTAAFRGTEVSGINKSIPHKGHRSNIVIVGSTVNSVSGFVVFDCLLVNAAERCVSGGFLIWSMFPLELQLCAAISASAGGLFLSKGCVSKVLVGFFISCSVTQLWLDQRLSPCNTSFALPYVQSHFVHLLFYMCRPFHDSWCLLPELPPRQITGIPYPATFNTLLLSCVCASRGACLQLCVHTCFFSQAGCLNRKSRLTSRRVLFAGFVSLPLSSFFFYSPSQRKRDTVSSAALGDCWWLMHLLLELCLFNASPSLYRMLSMALSAGHVRAFLQQSDTETQ